MTRACAPCTTHTHITLELGRDGVAFLTIASRRKGGRDTGSRHLDHVSIPLSTGIPLTLTGQVRGGDVLELAVLEVPGVCPSRVESLREKC